MSLIIQVIISMVVVYLIFSVVVYVIVEWIASVLQLRGRNLEKAILNLFEDVTHKRFGREVYEHPQVSTLIRKDTKRPSYIPARNVTAAMIDIVSAGAGTKEKLTNPFQQYIDGLQRMPDGPLKTLLVSISQPAKDMNELMAAFEKWYNDYMDRVTGWYKKQIRWVVLAVSLAVTIGFNVDSIYVLHAARTEPATREYLNTLAVKLASDSGFNRTVRGIPVSSADYFNDYVNDSSVQSLQEDSLASRSPFKTAGNPDRAKQLQDISDLAFDSELPVGWYIKKNYKWPPWEYVGWLITALALSAGAPFWFDMLKKLINIRNAGPKPDEKKEK